MRKDSKWPKGSSQWNLFKQWPRLFGISKAFPAYSNSKFSGCNQEISVGAQGTPFSASSSQWKLVCSYSG